MLDTANDILVGKVPAPKSYANAMPDTVVFSFKELAGKGLKKPKIA